MHPTELPGDLPVPFECHSLTLNMIALQLSDAVADANMTQCSAHFKMPLTSVHFVANNATQALASSATLSPTFNNVEEDAIHNGWTPLEIEI